MNRKVGTITMEHLLEDERVRKTQVGDQIYYSAVDLMAALTDSPQAHAEWDELKDFEPALRSRCTQIELGGRPEDALNLAGVARLIQAVESPAAERLRGWLSQVAAQHMQEEADPALAIQRMRQGYGSRGHSRQWIDQRLRTISARQELVHEWYKRGIKDSEQFRTLTNKLMQAAFGMDVNAFLQFKGAGRHLRDHLSDLELALVSLAETTAASLHRRRQSNGMDQLLRDVEDAGRIVAQTRQQIEQGATSAPESRVTAPKDVAA